MFIVGKYEINLHLLWNRSEKLGTDSLSFLFQRLIQIGLVHGV